MTGLVSLTSVLYALSRSLLSVSIVTASLLLSYLVAPLAEQVETSESTRAGRGGTFAMYGQGGKFFCLLEHTSSHFKQARVGLLSQ